MRVGDNRGDEIRWRREDFAATTPEQRLARVEELREFYRDHYYKGSWRLQRVSRLSHRKTGAVFSSGRPCAGNARGS